MDAHWNAVSSTHTVAITSSDPDAGLPPNAALVAGAGTFAVTAQTGGPTTVTASDVTDGTKTPGLSSSIAVTNTAPTVVADGYSMVQDRTLTVLAAGVLANDTDPEGRSITVATPRPITGPAHGTLGLAADGSFTYTPDAGYAGVDTFTYHATDGHQVSATATVTVTIASTAYASSTGWSTSFSASRYLRLRFPAYVPAGSVVTGATFTHTYRSETAGDTTCYYVEVYRGSTLLATHGSVASPVSCNATTSWATDAVSLPEVSSACHGKRPPGGPVRAELRRATLAPPARDGGGRLVPALTGCRLRGARAGARSAVASLPRGIPSQIAVSGAGCAPPRS